MVYSIFKEGTPGEKVHLVDYFISNNSDYRQCLPE
jgi:hypothetical protein